MTVLETERLLLRLPRLEDEEGTAELVSDPDVMRFLGGETVPRAAVPAVVEKWLARWDANGFGPFAIERRDDGRFLGRVGFILWDTSDRSQSTLAARAWARARAHGIDRLISCIRHDNVRSQRVAERLGAQAGETVTLLDGGPHVVWVHPR